MNTIFTRLKAGAKAATQVGGAITTTTPAAEVITPELPAKTRPRPREVAIPVLRIPVGAGQWLLLLAGLYVFNISINTTHAFFSYMNPGVSWWTSFYTQVIFSIIERFLFTGNRNALTIGTLLADGLFNAAGLFIAYIPRFWESPVWAMLSAGLSEVGLDPSPPGAFATMVLALVCGMTLAYSNDKLFIMAMGGR